MAEHRLRRGTWVLICDAQKALLARNLAADQSLKLHTLAVWEQKDPLSREQGSSPPGRVFSSLDGRRAATQESDFHALQEEKFLSDIAKQLNNDAQQGKFASLMIIAPARAMGILRSALSDKTQKLVCGELARDYVKLPLHEVERLLAQTS